MSTLVRALTILVVVLGIGAALVVWDVYAGKGHVESENVITKAEMEALLRDIDPMQRKSIAENKDQKEKMLGSLKEILAVASEARKHGFASRPAMKEEMKYIDRAILALSYDKKINEGKGEMPSFGWMSENRVKEYWGESEPEEDEGWFRQQFNKLSWVWQKASARWREGEFENFIETKLALARERGQLAPDQEPTVEELDRARDNFARTEISYYDAKAKLASIPSMPEGPEKREWEHFETVVGLQARLQKAQLLNTLYSKDVLTKEVVVTDEEVQEYIAKHPELTKKSEQLNTAKDLLKKVKAGADLAELAKEYSDDPGSKARGGLYEGVVKGQFATEFEQAVDKLKSGETTPDLVETPFGYHIIKLEKRGEAKSASGVVQATYDVRHVLVSTMMKDPENPNASPIPVQQYVKTKLSVEKQKAVMAKIMAENPVSIAGDFVIPEASEEEMKKVQEEQQKRMKQMQEMQMQRQPGQQQQPARPAPPN